MPKENIPDLSFEIDGDQIDLEQDAGCGEVNRILLHRTQLLYLAQQVGLIRDVSQAEADDSPTPSEMARNLDSLKRNMLRVRAHALALQNDFRENADWKHADLTNEMWQINGLVDLLDMAVDDFSDDYTASDPDPIQKPNKSEEVITVITPKAEKVATAATKKSSPQGGARARSSEQVSLLPSA